MNRKIAPAVLRGSALALAATLAEDAPRPVIVHTDAGSGDTSALSTLLMAQLLPQLQSGGSAPRRGSRQVAQSAGDIDQVAERAARALREQTQG